LSHILLDTHAWAWSIWQDPRLSMDAIAAIRSAQSVAISTISVYEIGQKMRLGKWPEMIPAFAHLEAIATRQGAVFVPVTLDISEKASTLKWPHRDPFDRLIAATAMVTGTMLISADAEFDGLHPEPDWPGRIW
jgi:PIN domain nuclease of toxin-antitoxin system